MGKRLREEYSDKEAGDKEIELRPDGWNRFQRAVDAAVKSGPKHRAAKKTRASRGRAKGKKRGS